MLKALILRVLCQSHFEIQCKICIKNLIQCENDIYKKCFKSAIKIFVFIRCFIR